MAIYRGPGGSGDAIADSANTAQIAQQFATAASTSATNAANSATTASNAATAAGAAQTAAEAAQTAAELAETNAETAEANAVTAQTAAETARDLAEGYKNDAETAATTAENAAISATTSANAASASASSASSSASSASSSASAAASSASSAAASFDSFDDRYLGAKSSDPTLDNDGNALLTGALYFNTTNNTMKVYTGSAWVVFGGGDVVSDTTPQLGGALDTNGYAINFGDNDKATFGDSEDLWLYHDGGSSYLFDRGTGNLRIITNSTVSIDGVSGGEFMAQFVSNGAVSLYYDNSNKFQTTSTGVNVTGNIAVSGTVDGVDIAAGATNWDTAYGWGNHAAAGYLDSADIGVTVQGYDADTVKYDDVNPSFTDTGAIKIPAGTAVQRPGTPAAGQLRFNNDSSEFEGYNGTAWASVGGSAISNDTSTTSDLYPIYVDATTGTAANVYTSNAQYLFKPSTGELKVKAPVAQNGIVVNADTMTSNYTIDTGTNGFSVGPFTIAGGATLTIASGQRHLIL